MSVSIERRAATRLVRQNVLVVSGMPEQNRYLIGRYLRVRAQIPHECAQKGKGLQFPELGFDAVFLCSNAWQQVSLVTKMNAQPMRNKKTNRIQERSG